MLPSPLILVSRRSLLALRQSSGVKAELERIHPGLAVEILPLLTGGDRQRERPLPEIGGKGLFTEELEEALIQGRAHFAVHSLKDLPTELGAGLSVAAIPRREDARDALVSRGGAKLSDLAPGARIGTSSIRRAAELRRLRPDLIVESLRGNLETRLRKLNDGLWDAIVLAAAGLLRMGWEQQISEYLPETTFCPAAGQGALAVQARAADSETLRILAPLEDRETRLAVSAERAFLQRLGGGCQVPIAAYAQARGAELTLHGLVIRPDGAEFIETIEQGAVADLQDACALGRRAAEKLLHDGAARILEAIAGTSVASKTSKPGAL